MSNRKLRPLEKKEDFIVSSGSSGVNFEDESLEGFDFEEDSEFEEELADFEESLDFESTLKDVQSKVFDGGVGVDDDDDCSDSFVEVVEQPESVDDFVRNYLEVCGFCESLDVFNCEVLERSCVSSFGVVPNVYLENVELRSAFFGLREEYVSLEKRLRGVEGTFVRLKKERDFHKRQHLRVVEEKKRLLAELAGLKRHCDDYAPVLVNLKKKYERATKKKHLLQMKVDTLSSQFRTMQHQKAQDSPPPPPTMTKPMMTKSMMTKSMMTKKKKKKESLHEFPPQNTFFQPTTTKEEEQEEEEEEEEEEEFHVEGSLEGHTMSVGGCCAHPHRSDIVVSTGDDGVWKMWNVGQETCVCTGTGHGEWVSGCAFHPLGTKVVTCGGDSVCKVWDVNALSSGGCRLNLVGHVGAVWSVSVHSSGHFVVSGGQDHCVKVWDVCVGMEKVSLRGHKDGVNCVLFESVGNVIASASADRTISFWDPRSMKCIDTLFHHDAAVQQIIFTDTNVLAAGDAGGTLRIFDLRKMDTLTHTKVSHFPINSIAHNHKNIIAAATEDGNIYTFKKTNIKKTTQLKKAHKDAVLHIDFAHNGKKLFSASADATIKVWAN